MKVRTRRGKIITNRHGLPIIAADPLAPNAVDLDETISIGLDANGQKYVTLTTAASLTGYSYFHLIWKGLEGSTPVADGWTFPAATGIVPGGPAALGRFVASDPTHYSLHIIDTSGRLGFSTGTVTLGYVEPEFSISADPILGDPITEGEPMTLTAAVGVWDPEVVVTDVFEIAEDLSGTNAETVAVTGVICPAIDAPLDTLRYGQRFQGDGLGVPGGDVTYWSDWVAITATAVTTPVTNTTPPVFATSTVLYDGATNTAGMVLGATVSQTGGKSAVIVKHVSLTATTGALFLEAITSGPFVDNVALTGTNIAAVANGDSADYVPTEGGFIAVKPGTYAGTPTSNVGRVERATDASGTGAVTYTPSGGAFPFDEGGKYNRYVERVTGYGIAASPGYIDTATAWTLISDAVVPAVAPDEWFISQPSSVNATTDQMDEINVLSSLGATTAWWSTSTPEILDATAFPSNWEGMTLGTTRNLIRLRYTAATLTGFATGAIVTGAISGRTGTIFLHVPTSSTTGTLFFETTTGAFIDNEAITAPGGAASALGASVSVTFQKWATADAIAGTPPKNYRQFIDGADDLRRTRVKLMVEILGNRSPRSLDKTVPDAPPATVTQNWVRLVMRKEGQFLGKEFAGDGRQFPRSAGTSPAAPQRVFCGIDITKPMMTETFGEYWTSPILKYHYANESTQGAAIDREDGNRILHYGSSGAFSQTSGSNHNAFSGIWLSTDGGLTASQVLSLPDSHGANQPPTRLLMHCIAQAPGGTTATRTWYVAHTSRPWGGAQGETQIYKSTDGGATWATDGPSNAVGVFGAVFGLETRANGAGHDLYIWGEDGFRRRATGGTTLSTVTGLPAGTVNHVEVRGSTVWAIVKGVGLYKSTNGTSFTQMLAGNYTTFNVSKVAPYKWVWAASTTAQVQARWSEDGGVTWTHTNGGSTINNTIASQKYLGQTDDFSHYPWGGSVFFIPHETNENECLMMLNQLMGRLVLNQKDANGNIQARYSSRGCDYSRLSSVSWGQDYDEYAMGAVDRAVLYTDNGSNWVHDGPLTDLKPLVKAAISGGTGNYAAYQAGGPLILRNNGHMRLMCRLGPGGGAGVPTQEKVPCVFSPAIEDQLSIKGSAGTGSMGTIASLVMPKGSKGGTYELRCTTAATNSGTFTLYAPSETPGLLGAVIGTTNGSMGAQSIAWGGGNITFTLADGAADFAAGTNPSRFTWYHNPIGTSVMLSGVVSATDYGSGLLGEPNPSDPSKGCSGKGRYSMNSSGVVSFTSIANNFYGYASSVVIYGLAGDTIYRSPDEGATWVSWFTNIGSWSSFQKNLTAMRVSKHSTTRVFRGNNAGEVHKVEGNASAGSTATLVFDFHAVMDIIDPGKIWPGVGTPKGPSVTSIVEDVFDANLLHVSVSDGGKPVVFRSTVGGGAAANWEDITTDGLWDNGELVPNPYTGEVVFLTRHGTIIHKTPAAHRTANSITDSLHDDAVDFAGDAGNYVGV